jgi:hypothetical protein
MTTPVFTGTVTNGKLVFDNRKRFDQYLCGLRGAVEIVVRKRRKPRSDPQNRYYWGVVVAMLADYTGYTTEEMHEALKWKFLRKPSDDHRLPDTVRSTAELTTVEFERYCSDVRQWASEELTFSIPEPNEVEYAEQ